MIKNFFENVLKINQNSRKFFFSILKILNCLKCRENWSRYHENGLKSDISALIEN